MKNRSPVVRSAYCADERGENGTGDDAHGEEWYASIESVREGAKEGSGEGDDEHRRGEGEADVGVGTAFVLRYP